MSGYRIPLVLLWDEYLKEWRSHQTSNSVQGLTTPAAIFLRQPDEEALQVVSHAAENCFMIWDLLEGSPAEAELSRWFIPLPGKTWP